MGLMSEKFKVVFNSAREGLPDGHLCRPITQSRARQKNQQGMLKKYENRQGPQNSSSIYIPC